jgi:hypothetical protein
VISWQDFRTLTFSSRMSSGLCKIKQDWLKPVSRTGLEDDRLFLS